MLKIGLEMEKTTNLKTGLGMFCFHLGKNLLQMHAADLEFGCYLPKKQVDLFGDQAEVFCQKPWHKLQFPRKIRTDIWHCLHQDSAYYPDSGIPIVLTIHDLNFMQKYSGWKREFRKRKLGKLLENSSALVCISQQTGKHLESVYGLSSSDYRVIYNGNALRTFPGNRSSAFRRERPFLLHLGLLSERKNTHVLCGMLASLPDFDLILAGPAHESYRKTIVREAARFQVADRLIFAGEVSEEEKFRLIQQMDGLVFPSLAEGFGLPVVEAMSMGKPVFLSRNGSLPEIGGNEAFYWDNFEADSMAAVVKKGLRQASGSEFEKMLKARAAIFSWEKAAEDYASIYRSFQ
jgi:glycosyltransferase involved in cell wall biosynthesis